MRTVGPRFTRAASWRRAVSEAPPRSPGSSPERSAAPNPLAAIGMPLGFQPGVDLFQQGARAENAFYVLEGLVKLVRIQPSGREAIVGLRSREAVLGAAAVLAEDVHPVTATTVTRCQVTRMEASTLRRRLREDQELSLLLHRAQSTELNAHHIRVADLCSLPAGERLMQFLAEFLELLGGTASGGPRKIPLTQSEIASAIGVTTPYLCRLLHRCAAEGSVRWEQDCLVLVDSLRSL